jgi:hypothetical protein
VIRMFEFLYDTIVWGSSIFFGDSDTVIWGN